ncbi:MAG: DMT family transporter [Myxococcota bacterium]
MTGVVLGVAAAFCWAGLDVVRKALADKASPVAIAVVLLLGQLPFLFVWASIDGSWVARDVYWGPALGSMAMNALANVFFMRSLQLSPMSRTVPFLALSPAFSLLVAAPLLGEVPSLPHVAGVALVVAGSVVLNSDLGARWWGGVIAEPGARYMIAVAFLWAGSLALDKVALPHAAPSTHALILTAGSGVMLLLWVASQGRLGELRVALRAPRPLLFGLVAFAVAAIGLQMLALGFLWVAVVETLKRGLGVVGSIVFGRIFFLEPFTGRKIMAAGLMAGGAAVLALT